MKIEDEVRQAQEAAIAIANPDAGSTTNDASGAVATSASPHGLGRKLTEFREEAERKLADARGLIASKREGMREWVIDRLDDRTALIDFDSLSSVAGSHAPVARLTTRSVPAHVTSGVACLGVGLGLFATETELMRFTRALADNDGAALQEFLKATLLSPEGADISSWMDGDGGFAHRLFHGHDLAALAELLNNHAPTDAIVNWFNHVWLRDAWTPHGVPWLPMGSDSAYEFLRSFDSISPTLAMDVLTINAAEVASGLFLLGGGLRIRAAIRKWIERSRYAKHFSAAIDCAEQGNHGLACNELRDAELYVTDAPAELRLEAASFALAQATPDRTAEQILDYAASAWEIASGIFDPKRKAETIPYHGETRISFLGIVTSIMTSAYALMLRRTPRDWDRTQREQIRLGISACVEIARSQSDIGWTNGRSGFRPYSALSNQILALELAHAASFCREPIGDPPSIRRAIGKTLLACDRLPMPHHAYVDQLTKGIERLYPVGAVKLN